MVWIAACIVFLLVLTLLLSFIVFKIVFYSPVPHHGDIHSIPSGAQYQCMADEIIRLVDKFDAIEREEVNITSRDGTMLCAKYYHTADDAPLDIAFHGYRSTGIRDFCGGAMIALDAGHNLLLVDQRAHGESGGSVISFGIRERYDCLDWIDYAIRRFGGDVNIILDGVSMGAATVLMASDLPLPDNVKGIIADCPYSSPVEILKKSSRDRGIPPALAMPLVQIGAWLFGNFRLSGASAVTSVTRTGTPVLIIHGEADRFVPYSMGLEIYNSCAGKKHFLSVPGAGHAMSYLVDRQKYTDTVNRFYDEVL